MRAKVIQTVALSDDADGIATSQTPSGAGSLTLDGALVSGGVGVFPEAQIITVTWAGNDTARTLTVTYKDADGNSQTGTIAGANATTSASTFYAKSISDISIDAASAGALTVGATAASGMVTKSVPVNWRQSPFNMSLTAQLTAGTGTVSAQYTVDAPEDSYTNGYSNDANWRNTLGLTAVTATDESNIAFPVRAVRGIQTVGSATGTWKFTFMQGQNG